VIKRTPLAYAPSEGHKEIVELLIAKSAVFRADKY
jgi:ankyrin repeat protein